MSTSTSKQLTLSEQVSQLRIQAEQAKAIADFELAFELLDQANILENATTGG